QCEDANDGDCQVAHPPDVTCLRESPEPITSHHHTSYGVSTETKWRNAARFVPFQLATDRQYPALPLAAWSECEYDQATPTAKPGTWITVQWIVAAIRLADGLCC